MPKTRFIFLPFTCLSGVKWYLPAFVRIPTLAGAHVYNTNFTHSFAAKTIGPSIKRSKWDVQYNQGRSLWCCCWHEGCHWKCKVLKSILNVCVPWELHSSILNQSTWTQLMFTKDICNDKEILMIACTVPRKSLDVRLLCMWIRRRVQHLLQWRDCEGVQICLQGLCS